MTCDPHGPATADIPVLRLGDTAVVRIHTCVDDPPF